LFGCCCLLSDTFGHSQPSCGPFLVTVACFQTRSDTRGPSADLFWLLLPAFRHVRTLAVLLRTFFGYCSLLPERCLYFFFSIVLSPQLLPPPRDSRDLVRRPDRKSVV